MVLQALFVAPRARPCFAGFRPRLRGFVGPILPLLLAPARHTPPHAGRPEGTYRSAVDQTFEEIYRSTTMTGAMVGTKTTLTKI